MALLPKPKIGFNYFGKQFQNFSSESLFYSMPQNCGAYRGPQNIRLYEIEINGFYKDHHLEFRWEFNSNCHSSLRQQQLMAAFLDALEDISKIILAF
jgi:non-ribosomal peptide synthase protein (TIGR01720 family)